MPRRQRLTGETGFVHIVARGTNRQDIFYDDQDRMVLLKYISVLRKEMDFSIIAYCFMSNHIHLVLYDKEKRFSKIMQRLFVKYVKYFNAKYDRVGHLFQDRFSSECIESERYLLTVVRYIHNNPVKAGISSAVGYRWSSMREYVFNERICSTGFVLSKFPSKTDFMDFSKVVYRSQSIELLGTPYLSDEEAARIICGILNSNDPSSILQLRSDIRDAHIREMKRWGIGTSQISRVTGISKSIIRRIRH